MANKPLKPGTELSLQEQKEMFEARESWCAVEQTKESAWCRKQRKHFGKLPKTSVFSTSRYYSNRCDFKVDVPKHHKERRHYEQHREYYLFVFLFSVTCNSLKSY